MLHWKLAMDKTIKKQFIATTFASYNLNTDQKEHITKIIDGCIDLIDYQTGTKGIGGTDVNILAGLIKGHITNILNVLKIERLNGGQEPQFKKATSGQARS